MDYSYGIINACWRAAGQNVHGSSITCLCADMTTDRDAAHELRRMLLAALEQDSEWTIGANGDILGRLGWEGDIIYWWHNNGETAWTTSRPDWWDESDY